MAASEETGGQGRSGSRQTGQFTCEICFKTYTRASTLRNHRRSHTQERPYRCQQCNKAFMSNDSLRAHQAVHNPGNFECPNCGASFSRKSSLRRHQASACPVQGRPIPVEADETVEEESEDEETENLSRMQSNITLTGHPVGMPITTTGFSSIPITQSLAMHQLTSGALEHDVTTGEFSTIPHPAIFPTEQNSNAWFYAARNGDVPALQTLYRKGNIDVNARHLFWNGKEYQDAGTALHLALTSNSVNAVQALINMGADIESRDGRKRTPLSTAVAIRLIEISLILLDKGADMFCEDASGKTPLEYAMDNFCPAIFPKMLSRVSDLDMVIKGKPLVHLAISQSNNAALSELLSRGARADATATNGNTILHEACSRRNPACTKLILQKANLTRARNKPGRTALHELFIGDGSAASISNHTLKTSMRSCLDLLLEYGAEVNAVDQDGKTPLMALMCLPWALWYEVNSHTLAQTLLEWGADPNLIQAFGIESALDLAMAYLHDSMRQLPPQSNIVPHDLRMEAPESIDAEPVSFEEFEKILAQVMVGVRICRLLLSYEAHQAQDLKA